jgi:hypothetical protein
MASYLFIESRDPFESKDTQFVEEIASALKQRGNTVTVFFVQNGVFAARARARVSSVDRLAQAGVTLLVDDFSLGERGIEVNELHASMQPSSIEALVDSLAQENTKAIWH